MQKGYVFGAVLIGALVLSGAVSGQEEAEPEAPWRQRADFYVSGSSGNTDSMNMRAGWRADREKRRLRTRLDASYNLGLNRGRIDQSRATSGALFDRLLGEESTWDDFKWLAFLKGRYDFDNFRVWRHRASSHGGLARILKQFEDEDSDFELLARAGLGVSKQWERTDDLRPEALLGAEMVWNITDAQSFTASSYMYPELLDLSKYRLESRAEFNVAIERARGMNFVCGVAHDYESSAGTEHKNWDFRYYAGISIAF